MSVITKIKWYVGIVSFIVIMLLVGGSKAANAEPQDINELEQEAAYAEMMLLKAQQRLAVAKAQRLVNIEIAKAEKMKQQWKQDALEQGQCNNPLTIPSQ